MPFASLFYVFFMIILLLIQKYRQNIYKCIYINNITEYIYIQTKYIFGGPGAKDNAVIRLNIRIKIVIVSLVSASQTNY